MKMIKKITICLLFAVAVMTQAKANDADLFSYDQNAVQAAVSELVNLENYVASNPAISAAELVQVGNVMVNGLSFNANPFMSGEPPLGIPSFWWGCVFGVVGMLVVYIVTDNDKEEFKKSLWGCVTGTAVSVIFYFVWVAVFVTTTTNAVTYP